MRDTVGALTLYSRAISAPVLRPDNDAFRDLAPPRDIKLPPSPAIRPSALAARPAEVRSRIIARSNSAKAPLRPLRDRAVPMSAGILDWSRQPPSTALQFPLPMQTADLR